MFFISFFIYICLYVFFDVIQAIQRSAPRPLTRSIGVGEGNVHDTSLQIHEKELRTVIIGGNSGALGKRNVGVEVRNHFIVIPKLLKRVQGSGVLLSICLSIIMFVPAQCLCLKLVNRFNETW